MSWAGIKYFKPSEFDQPGKSGSGINMKTDFILKLDKTRELFGQPMIVTSGYRSPEYDKALVEKIGKKWIPNNAHTAGFAADIKCSSSRDRFLLIRAAMRAGIHRIGFDDAHVHLDDDPKWPADVLFWEGER